MYYTKNSVIEQKDGTYALVLHIPCGVITPEELRNIASVTEKYKAQAIKISSAMRLVLVGIQKEDIDAVWNELAPTSGSATGPYVRSIRSCPGNNFCKIGKQNSLNVGLEIDSKYHGTELPGKFKVAVSGCKLDCAEAAVRDFGLIGDTNGFRLLVGGNIGATPRFADEIAANIKEEDVLDVLEKILSYYRENANKGERFGKMIVRLGLDTVKAGLGF